jgi:hypothetical protein
MSGIIPPLPQYAFMAWRSVIAQAQLYLLPLPFVAQIFWNENKGWSTANGRSAGQVFPRPFGPEDTLLY